MIHAIPSTFRVITPDRGTGTAFHLHSCYLLTARHCTVGGEETLSDSVTVNIDGKEQLAEVIWRSEANSPLDAAILSVLSVGSDILASQSPAKVASIKDLQRVNSFRWRASGYAIGDPERLGLFLTGTIAGIQETQGIHRLQLTCDQFGAEGSGLKGSSGGAVVLNEHVIGMISRFPQNFNQRILYASLLTDVMSAFVRSGPQAHVETLREMCDSIYQLILDDCDEVQNRYFSSLESIGYAFHERAILTPLCSARPVQRATLESTYVPVSFRKVSSIQDCLRQSPNASKDLITKGLDEVIQGSYQASGQLRLVVTGLAGAGKTSLLGYIAYLSSRSASGMGLRTPMLPLLVSLPELSKVKCTTNFADWLTKAESQQLEVCEPSISASKMEAIAERTHRPWFLLCDGLDEIPTPLRREFWISFRACVIRSHLSWCIASRPPTNLDDYLIDIVQRDVPAWSIESWTEVQLTTFVKNLLRTDTDKFLSQFGALSFGNSTATPLLALIAVCVYDSNSNTLPKTKASLYRHLIDNTVLKALRKGIIGFDLEWISENNVESLIDLLAVVAIECVRNPHAETSDDIHEWLAGAITTSYGVSATSAKRRARDFLDQIVVRSGLLVVERDRLRWWHSSIKDYLAGLHLAKGSQLEQRQSLERWDDSAWQEAVIFMMSILSDEHRRRPGRHSNVNELFREMMDHNEQCGLFLYNALAEGACVNSDTEEFIIESLVCGAIKMGAMPECESFNDELKIKGRSPVELLFRLRHVASAVAGIKRIRDNSSVQPWMREQARFALAMDGEWGPAGYSPGPETESVMANGDRVQDIDIRVGNLPYCPIPQQPARDRALLDRRPGFEAVMGEKDGDRAQEIDVGIGNPPYCPIPRQTPAERARLMTSRTVYPKTDGGSKFWDHLLKLLVILAVGLVVSILGAAFS
jgi:uncharacterized membrane protein (DUF373 family)